MEIFKKLLFDVYYYNINIYIYYHPTFKTPAAISFSILAARSLFFARAYIEF